MPSDWMFNFDLKSGRVRCHARGDIVRGKNMDWARVSGLYYLIQKLGLYFIIPKGEIVNDPDLGCCLHNYLFDKVTEETLALIQVEVAAELQRQIPELGVQWVEASFIENNAVNLKIIGYATWIFQITRGDLLDINLTDIFGGYL